MRLYALFVVGLLALDTNADASYGSTATSVLGTWRYQGTIPPAFVRHGAQVARLTLTMHKHHLAGMLVTGRHRYPVSASYTPAQREMRLTVHTARGIVRMQATLWRDNKRMIGTWSDTRGDDGGFVLVRLDGKQR